MYGGLAAAMQQNNANAFRVFGLKNDLDQQRRANAIQDQGLLWAGQDRAAMEKERERRRGIEDTDLKRRGLLFDQGQADYAEKKAEAKREKAYKQAGIDLWAKGEADIPGMGHATHDPQTGKVRLKRPDGGMAEAPAADFFRILGVDTASKAAPKDDSIARASAQDRLAESFQLGAQDRAKAIAVLQQDLLKLEGERDKAKARWFNLGKKTVAEKEPEIAAKTDEINALKAKIAEATATADRLWQAAAQGLLKTPAATGAGQMRYTQPGVTAVADPVTAPYYLAEGQGGLMPTQGKPASAPVALPTPEEARSGLAQKLKQAVEEEAAANVKASEDRSAKVVERSFSDKPSLPSIPKMRGLLGGLADVNSAMNKAGVSNAVNATMGEIDADKGRLVIEFVKALGERGFLLAWNTAHPDLAMSKDQWAEFKQDTSRLGISPTVKVLGKWLSAHQ